MQFANGLAFLRELNESQGDFDPFRPDIQQAIYWLNAGK